MYKSKLSFLLQVLLLQSVAHPGSTYAILIADQKKKNLKIKKKKRSLCPIPREWTETVGSKALLADADFCAV